jgi:hypothetical protein
VKQNDQVDFGFNLKEKFTLREWKVDGRYEWSLPEDHGWAKCLEPIGETFDDGRYRQVYYEAANADCKDTFVRVAMPAAEAGMAAATTAGSVEVTTDGSVTVNMDVPPADGSVTVTTDGTQAPTKTYTFTVWYEGVPAHDGALVDLIVDD